MLKQLHSYLFQATIDDQEKIVINVDTPQVSQDIQAEGGLETVGGEIQATKRDAGKPRMAIVPVRAKKEVARVFTTGAVKYDLGNWHNGSGFDYDRPLSAAERHIDDFNLGKRIDSGEGGSQCHILANAICELMFVLEFELSHHGKDNRTIYQYLPDGVEPFPEGFFESREISHEPR